MIPNFGMREVAGSYTWSMTLANQSISSIGQICSTLQRPYGTVRKAIESLGITPVLVINMVAHYADEDVERLRDYLGGAAHKRSKRRMTYAHD